MTYGLKVYDQFGAVVMDTSTDAALIHTFLLTNAVNGSYTLPLSAGGRAVFAAVSQLYYTLSPIRYPCYPRISILGRTVTWTYTRQSFQQNIAAKILIGTY